MKKLFILLIISITIIHTYAQEHYFKALYINGFVDIIDIPTQETKLLKYAQENSFNYLIIYNITKIHRNRFPLDNQMTDDPFANFIRTAKTKYGIKRIAVVGEKAASFYPIIKYNENHKANKDELIDGFNLEFEFWNSRLTDYEKYYCKTYLNELGLPCNRKGAFFFYLTQLKELRGITNEKHIMLESYVGNVTKDEMQELIQYLNTIHIHYYRKNMKNIAKYKSERIDAILEGGSKVEVFPIFSSRDKHLKPWLKDHSINEVFPVYMEQIKENESLYPIINNIKGQSWYRYSDMPK